MVCVKNQHENVVCRLVTRGEWKSACNKMKQKEWGTIFTGPFISKGAVEGNYLKILVKLYSMQMLLIKNIKSRQNESH